MFEEYSIDLVSKDEQFDPLNPMQNDRIWNVQINTIQVIDENDRLLYNQERMNAINEYLYQPNMKEYKCRQDHNNKYPKQVQYDLEYKD